MTGSSRHQGWIRTTALAVTMAVAIAFFISYQVFGGSMEEMLATAGYPSILFINLLVGLSIALFIVELRRDAIRVLITVVVALILGYLMTSAFNLDEANRFASGEFKVSLISEAEPIENDELDIQYGRSRGDEFNAEGVQTPLTEASYHFEGRAGDVVTVLAFAANRRSQVNIEVELQDESGSVLAQATSATPEQIETYEDLLSENDAVIEHFALPADGVYVLHAQPEAISTDVVVGETVTKTNAAYDAFLTGALERVNRWSFWIQDAITLIMIGLAIAVVFTAQQFSLGAEGQIYLGALFSGIVLLTWTEAPTIIVVPLALLAAVIAGFLWGLLPGVLKAYLGANELVATLMLNTVAISFFDLVLNFQLKPPDAGGLFSAWFRTDALFSPIVEGTNVTTGLYILIVSVVAVWFLIRRTPLGYEIRMIGANIKFADYGGINTRRTIMLTMALSGVIAGLAGAHLAMGIQGRLIAGISAGLAFEGVVVALLARNNPLVVPFTGLLYAYLRAGARFMESDANVSFESVRVIQGVIILLITAEALLAFLQRERIRRRGTVELDIDQAELSVKQPLTAEESSHV
jgi:simple sugar transport system permease protein